MSKTKSEFALTHFSEMINGWEDQESVHNVPNLDFFEQSECLVFLFPFDRLSSWDVLVVVAVVVVGFGILFLYIYVYIYIYSC